MRTAPLHTLDVSLEYLGEEEQPTPLLPPWLGLQYHMWDAQEGNLPALPILLLP